MGSSKGAFSLLLTRSVSKNLQSFEKVSFGKFRSTMKIALFRESAPIAPIFFLGAGGGGGGASPDPARPAGGPGTTDPFFFIIIIIIIIIIITIGFFLMQLKLSVPKQSASYAVVTTHH
jgi:hypothetical protein